MLINDAYVSGQADALRQFSLTKVAAPIPMGRLAPHIAPAAKGPYKGLTPFDQGGALITQRGDLRKKGVTFRPAPAAAPAAGNWLNTAKDYGSRALQHYETFAAANPATASLLGQGAMTAGMMALPYMLSSQDDRR